MSFRKEILDLMKDWCDRILEFKISHSSPYIDGSILCPACTVVHGRIADLVFPFTLLYNETKEKGYLEAAESTVEWADRNVSSEDGLTVNDRGNLWKGTAAFYAMALGEALHRFGNILPLATKSRWEGLFLRITDACLEYFDSLSFSPNINYRAGAAALFALAYVYTGQKRYLEKANKWELYCRQHFDANGLFYGEGKPIDGTTEKGAHCIDMGYNVEESIPLLIIHSKYLSDEEKLGFYTARAIDHLEFMLGDGGIDNSFGTRHNKWTYWGSRTSDGLCEGFVYVAGKDKRIAKAIVENFRLLKRCTHDKLLFPGLMAKSAGEVACLHHAFTHAKALATLYLDMNEEDYLDLDQIKLPREVERIRTFQNGSLCTVTKGSFTATVNACDFVSYQDAENGGGALSLLWNKKYGAVLASTTYRFVATELLNMQYQRGGVLYECMTPRFEDENGYVSVKDLSFTLSNDDFSVTAVSRRYPISFGYTFEDDKVTLRINSEKDGYYILPVVSATADKVSVNESEVVLRDILSVRSNTKFDARYRHGSVPFFHTVGGFEYIQLVFKVEKNKETVITVSEI